MNIIKQFGRNYRKMSSTTPLSLSEKAKKLLNPKTTIAKIKSQRLLNNENARFINLERIEYISPNGTESIWEMARRTTRPIGSKVDAVIIVPILKFSNDENELVFVRQFRPPTGGICVEFPAGLVDPNDSIESCALRELKEETGFVGTIRKKTGIVWSDPGLTDANCSIVWIDVDMEKEENKNPTPHWMDGEVIEVVRVKILDVEKSIQEWSDQGYLIDAKVQTLLIGMNLAL